MASAYPECQNEALDENKAFVLYSSLEKMQYAMRKAEHGSKRQGGQAMSGDCLGCGAGAGAGSDGPMGVWRRLSDL
jgi:hypothetical protein